jgi:molybdopterin/thiamine biosynthesis adenylyltransferase
MRRARRMPCSSMLTDQQIERYSRQIILPQLGGRGQQRLLDASVAVVGSDDHCATAAVYLAAAGVGRLSLSLVALPALTAVNPDCALTPLPASMTRASASEIARTCDVVLGCGAGNDACTLLNAACVAAHTPFVWGDTHGWLGRVAVLAGADSDAPCYACLRAQASPEPVHSEQPAALADATAAFIGTLQATEAIKLLLGMRATPAGLVLTYDALAGAVDEQHVAKYPHCATCGAARA